MAPGGPGGAYFIFRVPTAFLASLLGVMSKSHAANCTIADWVAWVPRLASVAIAYLLTPRSAAQAERTFSLLGHVKGRHSLVMCCQLQGG